MTLFIFFLCLPILVAAVEPECRTFEEVYGNGKNLCERMYGDAFVYSTDEDKAYTMWFFDAENPNDDITTNQDQSMFNGYDSTDDDCHLQYYHKSEPSAEGDDMTECHPWKSSSCCTSETVRSATALKEGYGAEYHWDRCGKLTQACERFFVQESCFYECDLNAGLFRRFAPDIFNASNPDHNSWEMYQMPIKASYCDAWYTACRHDSFCASDGGDYFSCAKIYEEHDNQSGSDGDNSLQTGVIIGIVLASLAAVAASALLCVLVRKEQTGHPLFSPLVQPKSVPQSQPDL